MNISYGIAVHGVWKSPEKGESSFRAVDESCTGLGEDSFAEALKEELDVPDRDLTRESIKADFGYNRAGLEISDACLDRIIAYYSFRKTLYEKICRAVLGGNQEALAAETGFDRASYRYSIPAEFNNFSCEDPDYTGGQTEAWIEITVEVAP